jgi:hypothetical protein
LRAVFRIGLYVAVFSISEKQVANQGNAQREGNEQKIFHEARALFQPIVSRVGFDLLARDDRIDVFQEIDAALLALTALPLLMLAGRTFIAQRRVAARAESRDIAGFGAAFRALHTPMLPGTGPERAADEVSCIHTVNTDYAAPA